MKLLLSIDPGSSSGAIAIFDLVGRTQVPCLVRAVCMPNTMTAQWAFLKEKAKEATDGLTLVIEQVGGSMPGNSAKSSRTFAEHTGGLQMAAAALGIEPVYVLPRKWLFDLFQHNYPSGMGAAEKKARKHYVHEHMTKRWPDVPFTERQSDSVAIGTWYLTREKLI